MKKLALVLTLAVACHAATIILVRHAERAGDMSSADVPLNERGLQRAEALASMLADAGVHAIFTSEAARAQQTAAPLAKLLRLDSQVVPAADVAGLVSRLKALAPNETVLVVGHSNTVPEIVRRLGAETPPLGETEFDRMLILVTTGNASPRLLTLRYGKQR